MITIGEGNILRADVEALVNPVNCMGTMGKGLALQFKKVFPENFNAYRRACAAGDVVVGKVLVVHRLTSPRYIINFPTKDNWRKPSKVEYIRDGLSDLAQHVCLLGINSIAIPPLGCGLGGLSWADVRPLIEQAFDWAPDVNVMLFSPIE